MPEQRLIKVICIQYPDKTFRYAPDRYLSFDPALFEIEDPDHPGEIIEVRRGVAYVPASETELLAWLRDRPNVFEIEADLDDLLSDAEDEDEDDEGEPEPSGDELPEMSVRAAELVDEYDLDVSEIDADGGKVTVPDVRAYMDELGIAEEGD